MDIKEITSSKELRIHTGEKSFYFFVIYYFSKHLRYKKMAKYHKERCNEAQRTMNIYCEGHRESAKTTILWIAFEIWKICYKKCYFICNVCNDAKKAKALNFIIANELFSNEKIDEDFWRLFQKKKLQTDEDFMSEKSISEFTTTNWIKVKAFGMGESLRGELYNHKELWFVRPDHVLFDDIDNTKNTKNRRIINDDLIFIRQEIFWWMDSNWQVIRLWNVIRQHGRNPSQREAARVNKKRIVFETFIYWEKGKKSWTPIWERFVNTDEEMEVEHVKWNMVTSLESKQREEWSNYIQNWVWTPMMPWETIIDYEMIKYWNAKDFDYIRMGCDPAFSTKDASDAFWLVVTGHKNVSWVMYYYVLYCLKLTWVKKKQNTAEQIVENLYKKWNVSRIVVEKNNWWQYFADWLIRRDLAVDKSNTSKDKLTRMKEHEGIFQRKQVFFAEWTEELIDQLIEFTWEDWNEDDLADAFMHSIDQEWWIDVLF